jgi:pyruvate dehydrogenase E1 component beta subunit
VAPSTPADARGLLSSALRGRDPTIFLEHAALYGIKGEVPDGEPSVPFGQARIIRPGRNVTIVSYSRTLRTALSAAQNIAAEGIDCEVIDLRTLRPLDIETVAASVRRTHRAVVVQEGWPLFSVASEIAAGISERCFEYLDAPVERVTGADVPMPYARSLESLAQPDEAKIADAVRRAVA